MKPMLARTLGPKFDRFPCFVQPKLNGVRALYQNGILQSRGEKTWPYLNLRHIFDELESIKHILGNTMLDGELYVHGWRLQRINSAVGVNNNDANEDTPKVEYHVFDVIDQRGFRNNFSLRWLDFLQSLKDTNLNYIQPVHTGFAHDRKGLEQFFNLFVSQGYEGLMARPDGPYEIGETSHGTTKRSTYLWKYKSWKDAEYECIGATKGEGKASIGIGALILRNAYGKEFHCGTGFDDETRIKLEKTLPSLVRVRYVEMTADGIPYPCTFEAVMA